jgi:hypothetical protein
MSGQCDFAEGKSSSGLLLGEWEISGRQFEGTNVLSFSIHSPSFPVKTLPTHFHPTLIVVVKRNF